MKIRNLKPSPLKKHHFYQFDSDYLQNIKAGEIRNFNLEIGVLEGAKEIARFERKVIQNLVHKNRLEQVIKFYGYCELLF